MAREWTDIDYAQAAIDMLPGSMEEIKEWMKTQKVKGRPRSAFECPLAVWVRRWTDTDTISVASYVYVGGDDTPLQSTQAMRDFMSAFDGGLISL